MKQKSLFLLFPVLMLSLVACNGGGDTPSPFNPSIDVDPTKDNRAVDLDFIEEFDAVRQLDSYEVKEMKDKLYDKIKDGLLYVNNDAYGEYYRNSIETYYGKSVTTMYQNSHTLKNSYHHNEDFNNSTKVKVVDDFSYIKNTFYDEENKKYPDVTTYSYGDFYVHSIDLEYYGEEELSDFLDYQYYNYGSYIQNAFLDYCIYYETNDGYLLTYHKVTKQTAGYVIDGELKNTESITTFQYIASVSKNYEFISSSGYMYVVSQYDMVNKAFSEEPILSMLTADYETYTYGERSVETESITRDKEIFTHKYLTSTYVDIDLDSGATDWDYISTKEDLSPRKIHSRRYVTLKNKNDSLTFFKPILNAYYHENYYSGQKQEVVGTTFEIFEQDKEHLSVDENGLFRFDLNIDNYLLVLDYELELDENNSIKVNHANIGYIYANEVNL